MTRKTYTVICPASDAPDVRAGADETTGTSTLAAGVPLIDETDPDDASIRAYAWDLPIPTEYESEILDLLSFFGVTAYERWPDGPVDTMSGAISMEGMRRKVSGGTV